MAVYIADFVPASTLLKSFKTRQRFDQDAVSRSPVAVSESSSWGLSYIKLTTAAVASPTAPITWEYVWWVTAGVACPSTADTWWIGTFLSRKRDAAVCLAS